MTTILQASADPQTTVRGVADGDDLWLPLDELTRTTGWELKPEGACRGDVCVPLPSGRVQEFVRGAGAGTLFNIAALARTLGAPVLRDAANDVWCIGEDTVMKSDRLLSLEAPDFALPDLSGRVHHLSDYRGSKLFMLAWASW